MTTTLRDTLNNQGVTPPLERDESWRYYPLTTVLDAPIPVESSPTASISPTGYYLHFLDGTCIGSHLPDSVDYTCESLDSPPPNCGFESLHSTTHQLTTTRATDHITIIYESYGYQQTHVSLCLNQSDFHLTRVFVNHRDAIQNNTCQIQLNAQSVLRVTDKNIRNNGVILDFVHSEVQADAHLVSFNESYLSNNARFEHIAHINGEQATVRLHGVGMQSVNSQTYYNTHVHHNVGDTQSHQAFQSLNQRDATFEYNGKVSVKKDAQRIESYQINKNILLHEYATIYSRPQLFIDADDVACSHGSTTGSLDNDQLFYLKSRGLNETDSKAMILKAFVYDARPSHAFDSNDIDINLPNML